MSDAEPFSYDDLVTLNRELNKQRNELQNELLSVRRCEQAIALERAVEILRKRVR